MKIAKLFVGVDVAKDDLDICFLPINKNFRVKNNESGLEKLSKELSKYDVERILCEASGGYEGLLVQTLSRFGYSVWRIEPKRIKHFIASEGIKAKTDKIDAAMIASFAQQKQLTELTRIKPTTENDEQLRALVKRKEELTLMVAKEKTRLDHPQQHLCRQKIKDLIEFINKQIKIIEKEIATLIQNDDDWSHKATILTSVPGIGNATAATLITHISELGVVTNKQAAAILGVVPYTIQSGKHTKESRVKEGRSAPCRAIYMAALSAIQYNQDMKTFYQRLVSAGKKRKVALVAVMRKLIILVNILIRENRLWKQLKNA